MGWVMERTEKKRYGSREPSETLWVLPFTITPGASGGLDQKVGRTKIKKYTLKIM